MKLCAVLVSVVCVWSVNASQLRGSHDPLHAAPSASNAHDNVVSTVAAAVNASGLTQAQLRQCLANKRVVFVGTSTLRYEYLTLAYFAEYGTWPSDMKNVQFGWPAHRVGPTPLNEMEVLWSTHLPYEAVSPRPAAMGCKRDDLKWESFYRYTNLLFNGHEVCDCYRYGNHYANTTENRMYTSAAGDVKIAYFQWWGQASVPRGMCPVQAFTAPGTTAPTCPAGEGSNFAWQSPVADFVSNIVTQMAPTHLVMNADWWPVDQLPVTFWTQLAAAGVHAVSASGGRAFFKQSPAKLGVGARQPNYIDMTPFTTAGWQMYNAAQIVGEIQTTWTNEAVFFDDMHLTPAANVHLLHRFVQNYLCQ
eukprot:TRINITY_DN37289_c0_g1_i1.p1 TRINITY_DN37289_c0_g1~~TRINITY_DN37289_c0_g1_i1.p1  ORF type:complete len:362 (+),score=25.39 TRINITY_DN37289_c0_g1_i1:50-1135(+)